MTGLARPAPRLGPAAGRSCQAWAPRWPAHDRSADAETFPWGRAPGARLKASGDDCDAGSRIARLWRSGPPSGRRGLRAVAPRAVDGTLRNAAAEHLAAAIRRSGNGCRPRSGTDPPRGPAPPRHRRHAGRGAPAPPPPSWRSSNAPRVAGWLGPGNQRAELADRAGPAGPSSRRIWRPSRRSRCRTSPHSARHRRARRAAHPCRGRTRAAACLHDRSSTRGCGGRRRPPPRTRRARWSAACARRRGAAPAPRARSGESAAGGGGGRNSAAEARSHGAPVGACGRAGFVPVHPPGDIGTVPVQRRSVRSRRPLSSATAATCRPRAAPAVMSLGKATPASIRLRPDSSARRVNSACTLREDLGEHRRTPPHRRRRTRPGRTGSRRRDCGPQGRVRGVRPWAVMGRLAVPSRHHRIGQGRVQQGQVTRGDIDRKPGLQRLLDGDLIPAIGRRGGMPPRDARERLRVAGGAAGRGAGRAPRASPWRRAAAAGETGCWRSRPMCATPGGARRHPCGLRGLGPAGPRTQEAVPRTIAAPQARRPTVDSCSCRISLDGLFE